MMKLYTYFRSSASYRIRIVLHLKGLNADHVPVHLVKGEQVGADYLAKNPQGLVPALDVGDGRIIMQSLAILDYLENTYPSIPLLPSEPFDRATVWTMCQMIACDTHPLNNLKVLKYLQQRLNVSDDDKRAWYAHWIHENFTALEKITPTALGWICPPIQPLPPLMSIVVSCLPLLKPIQKSRQIVIFRAYRHLYCQC